MRQPKLKKWQRLTEKKFNEIVTFEIQRQLHKKYLTEKQIHDLLGSGETTKQQFLGSMRQLFFESFTAILADLKLQPDISVYVTWFNWGARIQWQNIISEACDEVVEYREKRDMILPYRNIDLVILNNWPRYSMSLTNRVQLIVHYILEKNMRSDPELLEEAKGYKYNGTPITINGKKIIPHDLTNVLRMLGQYYGKMLKSIEQDIWQPSQTEQDNGGVIRIGGNSYD